MLFMGILTTTTWLVYAVNFVLGLSLGSFLNSWIWRTHENVSIIKGKSMCPSCRRQLSWYENIPVVSYLFLLGKCRTCKNPIPWHFVFVELGTAVFFLIITWHNLSRYAGQINAIYLLHEIFFTIFLIVIFIYDLLYKIILTELVWIGILYGFIFNIYAGIGMLSMLIASAVAGGFFFLQYLISKGKWIGGGDIRLGFMMGIWLGWPNVSPALAIAYIIGAVFSLGLVFLKGRKLSGATPFGTYLALGTFVTMIWGERIVGWYMKLLR